MTNNDDLPAPDTFGIFGGSSSPATHRRIVYGFKIKISGIRRKGAVMRRLGSKNIVTATALTFLLCLVLRAASSPASLPDSQQVIAFLDQTIAWYHNLDVEERLANQAADVLLVYDDRQIADQVFRLSFEFARADAQLLGGRQAHPVSDGSLASSTAKFESLTQLASKAAQTVHQKRTELEALKQRLPSAVGRSRRVLQSTIDEVQSGLELAETRSITLDSIVQFVIGSNTPANNAEDLMSQIAELEQSVPEARTTATKASGQEQNAPGSSIPSAGISAPRKPEPHGIIALGSDLVALRQKIHVLDQARGMTDALVRSTQSFMAPLSATLTDGAHRGDELSNQPVSTDPAVISQHKSEIAALESQFKQVSSAFLPLAKQDILLDRYQANLARWRSSVASQQRTELRSLLLEVIALGIVFIVAFGIFELWRRVTFHYVQDVRRRHQFLLLRRIVMFFVFATILALGFSTDLGSLTTFAGLLAAGLAVCLQSVILSTVGYFVLLGKYGIRIGDRLQILGVTGNVVDIDLMRLSLMELGETGSGSEGVPTGRTVEFPNAIVFQPTAGLFKQIPGANFLWREVTLALAAKSDYHLAEKRILGAVEGVFADYRDNLEQQYQKMERTLNLAMDVPRPESRLHFTPTGLELVVRYPITRENAADIDDRIARALLDVMGNESKPRATGSPAPNTQPRVESASPSVQHGA